MVSGYNRSRHRPQSRYRPVPLPVPVLLVILSIQLSDTNSRVTTAQRSHSVHSRLISICLVVVAERWRARLHGKTPASSRAESRAFTLFGAARHAQARRSPRRNGKQSITAMGDEADMSSTANHRCVA